MSFELIGDEIIYDGKTVAKLLPTVNATDRMNVEEALRVWKTEEEITSQTKDAIKKIIRELTETFL